MRQIALDHTVAELSGNSVTEMGYLRSICDFLTICPTRNEKHPADHAAGCFQMQVVQDS
jgi:hypothetical protein